MRGAHHNALPSKVTLKNNEKRLQSSFPFIMHTYSYNNSLIVTSTAVLVLLQ